MVTITHGGRRHNLGGHCTWISDETDAADAVLDFLPTQAFEAGDEAVLDFLGTKYTFQLGMSAGCRSLKLTHIQARGGPRRLASFVG